VAGRRKYTRTEYERILQGFRETPGNYAAASKFAGCDYRMAKRAWETGWSSPKTGPIPWARPVREVLAEEQAASRAGLADRLRRERELADAEAEKARSVAIERAAIEEQILQGARRNVAAVFGLSAKLVPAMDALVGYVRQVVLDPATNLPRPAADIEKAGIKADDALRLIGRHSLILQRAFSVGHAVIQLRRASEGLPTSVIGIAAVDLTPEAAAEELEAQEEAIRLIKAEAEGSGRGNVH
jgi:hypothetical protein